MKRVSVTVITMGVLAFASAYASNVAVVNPEPALVEVFAIPSKVSQEGAIPIPLSEVVKAAQEQNPRVSEEELDEKIHELEDRMDTDATASKRIWKSEETTTAAPHHGWGWGGWGGGWGGHEPSGPSMGLVGPFAFQLGAYYNPYLPMHHPPTTYGSSPSYGGHGYTTPAPSYGSSYGSSGYSSPSYTTPAPYHGSSYGSSGYSSSSYTTPAPYHGSSYGSSSYSSPSYTTPAPSYGGYSPQSYTSPSPSYPPYSASHSYSPPSYGYGASSSPY